MSYTVFKKEIDVPSDFTGECFVGQRQEHCWYVNGRFHREDGPAIETSTRAEWWLHGERHRLDGPARVSNLAFYQNQKEYWIYGERIASIDFPSHPAVVLYNTQQKLKLVSELEI